MEGILVIISFVFLVVANIAMWTHNPNTSFLDWYTGKGRRFEMSRLPAYTKALAVTGLASVTIGFLLSQSYKLTLEFTAINVGIMAVCGISLILYKKAYDH